MTTYNTIGHLYNQTRTADPYLAQTLFGLLQPQPEGVCLDIGCGTGNYTITLAHKGINMVGVEPSTLMLEQAKTKSQSVKWQLGSAENIPFTDNYFDGAIGTLTIHHWTNLVLAFKELYRVLKPNARMVIFTSTAEQMQGYWLNHYFPKMLESSIRQMPSYTAIESAVSEAGLKITANHKYYVKNDLQDKFLYVGKNQPKLYFDAQIRQGISSFAALANKEEVEQGLAQLATDIERGTFDKVKARYNDTLGDYLFVVIEK